MDTTNVRTTTVLAITAGSIITGFVAYAIYFDHRRRTDAAFRKGLKRESRAQAKAEREAKDAEAEKQKNTVQDAVERANREGYPDGEIEREQFFMEQIQLAEEYQKDGKLVESATAFFKTLKVYPKKSDLINIFDKSVQKDVLEILAKMIALDPAFEDDGGL